MVINYMSPEYYRLYEQFYQEYISSHPEFQKPLKQFKEYSGLGLYTPPDKEAEIKYLAKLYELVHEKIHKLVASYMSSDEYQQQLESIQQQYEQCSHQAPESDTDDDERRYRRAGFDC